MVSAIAVVALLLAGLTSCTSSSDSPWHFNAAKVGWSACPAAEATIAGLQCASYAVPMDYRKVSGKKIRLALRRMPATEHKEGVLFFNPGGPGGTGTGQFPQWYTRFPAQLREHYDIVSWDPRGVGESTAVQCYANEDEEGALLGPLGVFPTTFDGQKAFAAAYTRFGADCASHSAELARHVSTADTARDLEQLRLATGGTDLNYWGISYGTFLGMTYANLFPDHIASLVLDGNLSAHAWTATGRDWGGQTLGMRIGSTDVAKVFDQFLVLCAEAGVSRCAFAAGTPGQTRDKWDRLLTRLGEGPVELTTAKGTQEIELSDLVGDVSSAMDIAWEIPGSAQGWADTAAALQAIYTASTAQPTSTADAGASDGGTSGGEPTDTTPASYAGPEQALAVACGDAASVPRSRISSLAVEAQQEAGYLGLATLYFDMPCSYWKVAAADPYRGPWTAKTSVPVLVVNTTHDPSTPIQNARDNVATLASARLLTVDGYGHTSLLNPSACADAAIVAYVRHGALPAAGTRCTQDRQPFQN